MLATLSKSDSNFLGESDFKESIGELKLVSVLPQPSDIVLLSKSNDIGFEILWVIY